MSPCAASILKMSQKPELNYFQTELFPGKLNYESNTEETMTNAWPYGWSHLEDPEMDREHMMDLN